MAPLTSQVLRKRYGQTKSSPSAVIKKKKSLGTPEEVNLLPAFHNFNREFRNFCELLIKCPHHGNIQTKAIDLAEQCDTYICSFLFRSNLFWYCAAHYFLNPIQGGRLRTKY